MDMKFQKILTGITVLFLATTVSAFAWAAGRDKVKVQFDHEVHVNNSVLPPGHYTIQEMSGKENNNNVLQIYTDQGQKFETSFMTIDAVQKNPPPKQTKVVLERIGNDYYLDKIWIEGKRYGYQVPLSEQAQSHKSDMHPEEIAAILIVG
jgi:hypothetical protein